MHTYKISQILACKCVSLLPSFVPNLFHTHLSVHLFKYSACMQRVRHASYLQAKIHALNPAKPWSSNSFPKSSYSVC